MRGVTLVIKVRESADSDLPEKGSEDGNPPPFLSGKTSDSILGHNDLVATHRSDQTTVDDELCATFDGTTQCTIVFLLEECLEYGLVVPFPAYGFALWFRIMKA